MKTIRTNAEFEHNVISGSNKRSVFEVDVQVEFGRSPHHETVVFVFISSVAVAVLLFQVIDSKDLQIFS